MLDDMNNILNYDLLFNILIMVIFLKVMSIAKICLPEVFMCVCVCEFKSIYYQKLFVLHDF